MILSYKDSYLIDCQMTKKQLCAKLLRQLRNKIAHGDFIAFEEKIEEYAIRFLDGKFEFDYSEYSRKNGLLNMFVVY